MKKSFPQGHYKIYWTLLGLVTVWLLAGCSSSRFLKEDEKLLASVKLTSSEKHVKPSNYRNYIRQNANAKWFNLVKVPLGLYCMSGTDSTKRFNRLLHRIGEPPVIYDSLQKERTVQTLTSALLGKGYLHANVKATTFPSKKKVKVAYAMNPGMLSYVASINYEFDNERIEAVVREMLKRSKLYKGMPLNISLLDEERNRIIHALLDQGYYAINKDFITYKADTVAGDYGVDLTMAFSCPTGVDSSKAYSVYTIRDVRIYEDVTPGSQVDTTGYRGLTILYRDKLRLQRRLYKNHVYILPDSIYRESNTQNTYSALNALSAVNYSTVRFFEAGSDSAALDCEIQIKRSSPHTISTELEGTNTAGNLGAAVAVTYSNQNIFKGSETFSLKVRGAYEAITGLEGYNNQNYIEYSAESSFRFPTFMFPFLSQKRKQSMKAVSEISMMYNSQNRPEFHRRVLTGAWTYRWSQNQKPQLQHHLDLFSLNYVFMPWISNTFRKEYLENDDPRYSILKYSYEDLFIMRVGYSFIYNSNRKGNSMGATQTKGFQIKFNVETAGNLLYGLSELFNAEKDKNGQYSLFNIAYSQYAKVDLDYSKSFLVNERNSLALHAAFGLALPYGNSTIIPYEKRYFSGGANSVRGWGARRLGPGRYVGKDGKIDFINQTGNLKLDLSMEFRSHLFWKIHGAAFIDAGNVWNTRLYADQAEGQFKFESFYKQIAVAYGLGIRLNLDYFILRFDGGMKAVDPAVESGRLHYPLVCPSFKRDFTFHFAVGLPF